MKKDLKRRLSSRKLHVFILGTILITTLFVTGYLTGPSFTETLIWIFGLYSVGNVGEHFAQGFKEKLKE